MEEDMELPKKRITLAERKNVHDIDALLEGEPVYHLDPSVRIYWSVGVIISGIVVWLLLMLVGGLTMESVLGIKKEMFPLLFFTIVALLLVPYFLWVELNYHNYTYQFRKKRLMIMKGVLNKERTVIPYVQIQNINVNSNVLQRALGIATVKIETAGTNPWESEGLIDGIGDHHKFVSHAMELVESCKQEIEKKEVVPEKEEEDTEIFYLKQILAQLIELKKVTERKDKPEEPESKPKLKDEIDKLMRGKKKKRG